MGWEALELSDKGVTSDLLFIIRAIHVPWKEVEVYEVENGKVPHLTRQRACL